MIQFNIDELIKQYGPSVVSAAQQQVQVTVWQDVVWAILGLVVTTIIAGAGRWVWNRRMQVDAFDRGMTTTGAFALYALAVVVFLVFVAGYAGEAWTFSANPQYATLKVLKGLVGK